MVTTLQGQRIGYSVSRFERSAEGYRFDGLLHMELAMMGQDQVVDSRTMVTTRPDLVLDAFSFSFDSRDRSLSAAGAVQEDELIIRVEGSPSRVIQLKGDVYPMAALGRLVVEREMGAGDELAVRVFDPSLMAVESIRVRVLGREKVLTPAGEFDALKVETRMSAFAMTSWLDSAGMTLKELSPPGMQSVRTAPAEATAGAAGRASLDLLRMFRIEVDTFIPDPDRVRRARYEVSGIEPGEFPLEWDGQRLLGTEPLEVEVTVSDPPAAGRELPMTEPVRFLEPTVSIQCDDPALREKAGAVLAGASDAADAARRLTHWVYENVEKEPTASFPTALDVLRHMKGDCNEHAVFYAGLARAAGLPCRVAAGLVLMEGAFYYHAWNEVWLGDGWLPVDATFGQYPANALRLKLSQGELGEQAKILVVVGRLEVRLLEFE